jgi:hypothetical protein
MTTDRLARGRTRARAMAWMLTILLAAAARADTTVVLDFPPDPNPPPTPDRIAVKVGLDAKFAFEPNIRFTLGTASPGDPNVFVIHFLAGTNGLADGISDRPHREAKIYMGNLIPGSGSRAQAGFNDTPEKRRNAMLDVAAHELGHLFGLEHTCNAPADTRAVTTPDGHTTFHRTRGNGMLVNGRPGLMADGSKVLPDETAQDQADFTPGEKSDIINFIANLKAPNVKTLDARPGNTRSPKSLKTIRGLRADPNTPSPFFPSPYPSPARCDWVDVHLQFFGNAGWEFGYIALDGEFRALTQAGVPDGDTAFPANEILDFAIHEPSAPDTVRISFTEGNIPPQPSVPVAPNFALEPTLAEPYFRSVMLNFDTDNNPATQPMVALLTIGEPNIFDGLLPVPGCPADFNNVFDLSVQDIFDFLAAYFGGDPHADFNASGAIGVQDIFDFLAAYFAGCA